ncbi:MAG: triose-phosphate isomerase [Clostridiales Family XIII bacterium]|jgi:triosephosphate isomerase|nr:triose-phosphate isomerase [Clostridiales Family XIII bacterium]
MTRKKIIAGNWKMYKTIAEGQAFAEELKSILGQTEHEVLVCAPYTQLSSLKKVFSGSIVKLGAQNMHFENEGAFTGEISPLMLKEIGVDYCVIGHSERRQYFAETDDTVNRKLKAALAHGIFPIMCVGEVLAQRDAGEAFDVVRTQLTGGFAGLEAGEATKVVIAYEPVWAIGTGRTATPEQAEEMCAFIRETVSGLFGEGTAESVRIQYGGSVKPANAAELLTKDNIDGALVGGASLIARDFKAIIDY